MRTHTKGLLITALGVTILGPDTLFIRLVDENTWMTLFWRGVQSVIGFTLLSVLLSNIPFSKLHKSLGKAEWLLALCFSASTVTFINAVNITTVANTLVIIAAAPMIAAVAGVLFFKEPVTKMAMIAMALVMLGVSLVVQSDGGGNWVGDLCALGTALFIALSFLIARVKQEINRFPAMALSGLMVVLVSSFFIEPLAVKATSIPYLLILGFISTAAFALLITGPRYIPAHEVSLMMPLETVFGVLLVWWFLGEVPNYQTLLGGLIVLFTLAIYGIVSTRAEHN